MFSNENSVVWSDTIKKNAIIQAVKKEVESKCPPSLDSSKIGTVTIEAAALQGARSQGWRDCMEYIFSALPSKRTEKGETPFIDTSKD